MFQVFLILISQFIVIGYCEQVYPPFLKRSHQKLSVHVYLFVVFVFFGQLFSLIKDVCVSERIGECEIRLIRFGIILSRIREIITPRDAESVMIGLIVI
jgi:hypothetical protein